MSLFKKKTDVEPEIRNEAGSGRNKVSLLILLIILAVFGYLYFFTSLIVPHEPEQPAKPTPPAATPQVKQSMPPRPADTAATPVPQPAGEQKPADAKAAPAAPAQPTPPAATPPPAAAPVAKKEPAPPVKKEEPKPVKTAEKVVPAKEKQPAPAPPQAAKKEQKPAVAEEKGKGAKAALPAEKVESKGASRPYMIFVGEFSTAEASVVEAKLKKHKIMPVKTAVQKNRQMTRLHYGVYADYDSYSVELDKLKQTVKGAFAIEKDGKYSLYAGSFSSAASAAAERKRLGDKGVKVELQQVSLPLATVRLSAGPFAGKGAADKAAARLKGEGLKVKVIPKGK